MQKRVRTAPFNEGIARFFRTAQIRQIFDSMTFEITKEVICIPMIETQIRLIAKSECRYMRAFPSINDPPLEIQIHLSLGIRNVR